MSAAEPQWYLDMEAARANLDEKTPAPRQEGTSFTWRFRGRELTITPKPDTGFKVTLAVLVSDAEEKDVHIIDSEFIKHAWNWLVDGGW